MTTTSSTAASFDDIVKALTAAARQQITNDHLDVADLICQALAATAANLGGPGVLLGKRPGSWEAAGLYQLLVGVMSEDPHEWGRYRTEAVVVPLNVAELIEDGDLHPGLLGLDDAQAELDHHFDGTSESAYDEYERELEHLADRYAETYGDYGRRFAAAVRVIGASIEGLQAPPEVVVDADPTSLWWDDAALSNPGLSETDPLIVRLWWAAHDLVTLPNVDVRPGAGHE